jgi:hypothetical protein
MSVHEPEGFEAEGYERAFLARVLDSEATELRAYDAAAVADGDSVIAFHVELAAKDYSNARPGIEAMPWGTRDMTITDPFGNRLIFTDDSG